MRRKCSQFTLIRCLFIEIWFALSINAVNNQSIMDHFLKVFFLYFSDWFHFSPKSHMSIAIFHFHRTINQPQMVTIQNYTVEFVRNETYKFPFYFFHSQCSNNSKKNPTRMLKPVLIKYFFPSAICFTFQTLQNLIKITVVCCGSSIKLKRTSITRINNIHFQSIAKHSLSVLLKLSIEISFVNLY